MPRSKKRRGRKGERGTEFRRYVVAFIPAIILVAALVYVISLPPRVTITSNNTDSATLEQNTKAPDFTLEIITADGLTGKFFTFSNLIGKPVFMDFAFEWCPHCNNMAPTIKMLYENYHVKGVEFLTVAGSTNTDDTKTAEFVKKHEIEWTVVFDKNMEVFTLYGVRGTPTYFVIDPSGVVVGKLIGEQPYERLASLLDAVLEKT